MIQWKRMLKVSRFALTSGQITLPNDLEPMAFLWTIIRVVLE